MSRRARTRRRIATATAGVVLATTLPVGAPAVAADTATNWWWDTYDIGAIHEQGWTGDGVKIAILDDMIDPSLPAFAGRDLTVADGTVCEQYPSAIASAPTSGSVHGTTLTASLIGTGEGAGGIPGIAPDAEVTFYGHGRPDGSGPCTAAEHSDLLTPFGLALQRAVDDGTDIFVSSVGGPGDVEDGDVAVVANAIAQGVAIVFATGNPSTYEDPLYTDPILRTNGIVAVSGVDRAGELQTGGDGQPFVVETTVVVAAGAELPTVGLSGRTWDDSGITTGSSFAAPLVAGMLAVVAQRYPEATGNQLVQSLLHNTNGRTHELEYEPETGYGFGAAWLSSMLEDDPTGYPDENPLLDREGGAPTEEQVAEAAARGSAFPVEAGSGAAPSPEESEPAAPDAGPLMPALVVVLVVLGVVVIGGVAIILIVVTRKKRNARGGTP